MDVKLSCLVDHNLAVDLETAVVDLCLQLGNDHVCAGDSDGGADVEALVDLGFVVLTGEMAKGVHGDDLGGVGPLRLLVDGDWRLRVLEIGFVLGLKSIKENVRVRYRHSVKREQR